MNPQKILKKTQDFLEMQREGFQELADSQTGAPKETCQAAAAEFQEYAVGLGPVFATFEARDVVLQHIKSSVEAVVLAELDKAPGHPGLTKVLGALEQIIPAPHG